jgi:hypothetical protein
MIKVDISFNINLNELTKNNNVAHITNEVVIDYIKNKFNEQNLDYAVFTNMDTLEKGNKGFLAQELEKFNKGVK